MSDTTYVYSTTLTQLTCGTCAIPFAIPKDLYDARYADGRPFYCPNGHCISWSQTEADRLRKQLEQAQRGKQWERDMREAATRDAVTQRRRAAAARGQLTKIKNRITNGVCPVPGCKRSGFDDVARHISNVHPDYHAHEPSTGAAGLSKGEES